MPADKNAGKFQHFPAFFALLYIFINGDYEEKSVNNNLL